MGALPRAAPPANPRTQSQKWDQQKRRTDLSSWAEERGLPGGGSGGMGFQGGARVCWAAGREFLAKLGNQDTRKGRGSDVWCVQLGDTGLVGWKLTCRDWRACRCWVQGLALSNWEPTEGAEQAVSPSSGSCWHCGDSHPQPQPEGLPPRVSLGVRCSWR